MTQEYLTHATVRGLAALRGVDFLSNPHPAWRRACDGVLDLQNTLVHAEIPTCPTCAVMRDAALEGRKDTT